MLQKHGITFAGSQTITSAHSPCSPRVHGIFRYLVTLSYLEFLFPGRNIKVVLCYPCYLGPHRACAHGAHGAPRMCVGKWIQSKDKRVEQEELQAIVAAGQVVCSMEDNMA